MSNEEDLKNKVFHIRNLYENNDFNEALKLTSDLTENYSNNSFVQNFHGVILIALNNWKIARNYFLKAIKINKNFAEAFNNLGLVELNLGDLEKALENFLKAVEIKPDYENAQSNILKILTYFKSKKNKDNPYILADKYISEIQFEYDQNKHIENSKIINFYKKSYDIIYKKLSKIDTKETQIYRHNSIDLNCNRHFKVFNNFNVIPEFCFSCFKVTIHAKTVLELFKLYFVFDRLNLKSNNSRKLMVESRKDVLGKYKGFIYCSSVEEGESIKQKLKNILIKNIGNDCSISLKRGCSEFALKYPLYKKASINFNEMMSYDKNWKKKEEIIDNQIWNKNSQKKIINQSLIGPTLRDILVMRNWIFYARKIGDNSFH